MDFFFLVLPAHTASVTWKDPGELSDTNNEETKKQSAEEVARQKNPATDCSNPRRKKGEAAEATQSRKTPRMGREAAVPSFVTKNSRNAT